MSWVLEKTRKAGKVGKRGCLLHNARFPDLYFRLGVHRAIAVHQSMYSSWNARVLALGHNSFLVVKTPSLSLIFSAGADHTLSYAVTWEHGYIYDETPGSGTKGSRLCTSYFVLSLQLNRVSGTTLAPTHTTLESTQVLNHSRGIRRTRHARDISIFNLGSNTAKLPHPSIQCCQERHQRKVVSGFYRLCIEHNYGFTKIHSSWLFPEEQWRKENEQSPFPWFSHYASSLPGAPRAAPTLAIAARMGTYAS